ncbi:MAG: tetratricopeptide repeat protein, partial [Phycisphaerales bacterium]|nr:tetratricopeptide repeat protein [Phycisphaerales bacterium]
IVAGGVGGAVGGPPGGDYPEGMRFEADAFHEGLKQRGLTELLALHLREHPPADDVSATLLERTVKLSEHADPSRSADERRRSLAEANRLLERLIDSHQDDARTRGWRTELAKSLLYVECDALTSSLLHRGLNPDDVERLRGLMARTVGVLQAQHEALTREYESLDAMAAAQYDAMEANGDIDRLESDLAQTGYMLAWARYYHAAASQAAGVDAAETLNMVVEYVEGQSNLLYTPHAETHFQAQAQLLAGMTQRQLHRQTEAGRFLEDAIDIVEGILDDEERRGLEWVVQVGRIESIRSLRDAGSFERATAALETLRDRVEGRDGGGRGLVLVLAVLERSVFRAQADGAGVLPRDVGPLRERAVRGLRALAATGAEARREVYATLYDLLGPRVAVGTLTPFERCAVVSEMLVDAERSSERIVEYRASGGDATDPERSRIEDDRLRLLGRAVEIATEMAEPGFVIASDLRAEALFHLGVAEHHRGRPLESAQAFLRAGRDHPTFERGQEAIVQSVRTAAELQSDATGAAGEEVRTLYGEALATLVERHPESDAARYWRFFLAQHLAVQGRYDEAAAEYDRVAADHEHGLEARYLAAEARGLALGRSMAGGGDSEKQVGEAATAAIATATAAERGLLEAAEKAKAPERRSELRRLAARAAVLRGELNVMRGVDRGGQAIDALAEFETTYAGESELMGRVLRARLIALQSLGRQDEASGLIPKYIVADPGGAAGTLQGLFDAMQEEIGRDRAGGRLEDARRRAETACAVAKGLHELAGERADLFRAGAADGLRVQLAEATLESGDYSRAADLFATCYDADAGRYDDGQPRDGRVIRGRAEAYYGLGRFDEALPLFNTLFRSAQRGETAWWSALLRDLQCRAELKHDPAGIIKAIEQHKFYDKQMGGPELRRRFDALLTTSERRLEAGGGKARS